ncbi:MAG: Sporulation protein, YlmC/YmxH family [Desulfotomaculum sp. 46_296]|nr:MAG: Sporulation protein, YlmC/YmxH family [Desulfotomaculum sp. 46_296]KUK84550.1 MAG: Sporulation protein, YlmC/YmxH family [Desulfofundulus kuznetsovii]HAU31719.1 YlmC/YmxH family sporulation protein [Desulfotomaculum sp.]
MARISDLRVREVINIADGRRLGPIKDIDINLEQGSITSIIMPGPSRLVSFFGREEEVVIPWEKIKKIGMDVILVDLRDIVDLNQDKNTPKNKERLW